MKRRSISDAQMALKLATVRACKFAGGVAAAARATRADAARLSRYGNLREPAFAPIDVALELDRLVLAQSGTPPILLRAMANLLGFDLVPRMTLPSKADLQRQAGEIAKDTGALVSDTIEAAHDGVMTQNEARRIDTEAAEVEDNVVQLRGTVRRALLPAAAE